MPDAELGAPTVENVRVVVRVRPMDPKEKLDGAHNCVSVDAVNSTIAVTRNNATPPEPPRIYAYDAVFDSNTSQCILRAPGLSPRAMQDCAGNCSVHRECYVDYHQLQDQTRKKMKNKQP